MAKSRPTSPAFCFIAPTPYLAPFIDVASMGIHLVLAHIALENPEYAAFYKNRSDRGDYIICDNGAFELGESFTPDQLIKLGFLVGADALVLPDYPGKTCGYTVDAAEKWIPEFKQAGFDTMFVPQSEVGDLGDWIAGYKYATEHPDIDIIGMSILGIPTALPHIPPAYARVVMTQLLLSSRTFGWGKHHHYLGLNSGPALEVPPLLEMGTLQSVDSSGPIWAAINGHEYSMTTDSLMPVKKSMLPHVNFNHVYDENNSAVHRRVTNNIMLTRQLFQG